jgi:RNA polymerase sigma-70 factor (ECF subfamily)
MATDQTPCDEPCLVERARRGDFDAFERLVSLHEDRVYSVAMSILRDPTDAEDVAQTTFLKALENVEDFRGDAAFGSWVRRIAANTAVSLLRSRRADRLVPLDGRAPGESTALPRPEYIARWRENPRDLLARRDVRRVLRQAIDELPEHYRLVFTLRDIDGLSVRDTARALDITESNVKVRLMRARLKLREKLTHEFGDETTVLSPHEAHGHDLTRDEAPGPRTQY